MDNFLFPLKAYTSSEYLGMETTHRSLKSSLVVLWYYVAYLRLLAAFGASLA